MDDHQATPSKSAAKPRKKRRFLKTVVALSLIAIATVGALPWLLSTHSGRSWLVGRVNARLAPGSVRVGRLGLSWTGPIALDRVALMDPKGKTVLAADRLTLDRGLLGLIASRPNYGTITIEGATVDLERRPDGSVDLLDALASSRKSEAPAQATPPVVTPSPTPTPEPSPSPMAVTIVIKSGTLKVASPELVEPFAAGTLEGSLTIAPGKPIELSATFGDEGRSLEVHSTIDPNASRLSVVGKDWPIHVRQSGVEAKGRFAGNLDARQGKGFWLVKGDATLDAIQAEGPALQGDHLALDRLVATCDVEQSATGWTIRKLNLISPFASLNGAGTIPAVDGSPTEVRGKVDLAALAKMMPNAMRLRDNLTLDAGSATIRLGVTSAAGVDRFELVASLDDFAANEAGKEIRLRRPAYLAGKATRAAQKVTVETLEVKGAGIDVTAGGDLEAGVKLTGTVDLVSLMEQLKDVLDLGTLDLSGGARLAADYRHVGESYKGRFAVECKDLKIVGPTAVPIAREKVRLDGWAIGPSRLDGLPDGWHQGQFDLKADDLKVDVQANANGGNPSLVAGIEMLVESPVPGRFDARAKFRKTGTALEIDELLAGITPTDPGAASGTVALAVRGKFDPASGEGTFGPIPGQAVGAIGLGPDGAKVSGVGRSDLPLKVDAAVYGDLGAVDRLLAAWNGSTLKGLGGLWATQLSLSRSTLGKVDLEAKVFAPEVTYSSTARGPVSLNLKAGYHPEADRLDLTSVDLATQFGRVGIVGGIVETKGRRFFDLTATVEPSWAAIDPLIASKVEPAAKLRATVRPIHLAGMLRADSTPQRLNQISGEVELDLTTAQAFGLTLGETPVVLRFGQGLAKFDPIRTTLNEGSVSIVADLAMDGNEGVWLRVGTSKIDGATINQAVSDSILSYVAPVLAKSNGVTGKVTVAVDRAFVPITATGSLTLDGAMAFQDLTFQPGPLGAELTSITGRAASDLKLNEAMFVKVHDGRVEQSGLSIPLGGNLAVAIDGSVGFDETLDLKATIPVAAPGVGNTKVALPIRGTLGRPAVDRKALGVALRDAAKTVGEKRLKSEAARFLERIAGPNGIPGEPRSKP
jgi:translocation and assembly module TamB